MMGFVAKREIAGWPLVGWLATRGHTIYHQRGNTESLGGVMEEMAKRRLRVNVVAPPERVAACFVHGYKAMPVELSRY